ncbi:unnamed protein product [Ectocarpus sp. 4 AP-2014]
MSQLITVVSGGFARRYSGASWPASVLRTAAATAVYLTAEVYALAVFTMASFFTASVARFACTTRKHKCNRKKINCTPTDTTVSTSDGQCDASNNNRWLISPA